MQFKKTATIVLAATMIVTSFSFNTVSASETAEHQANTDLFSGLAGNS